MVVRDVGRFQTVASHITNRDLTVNSEFSSLINSSFALSSSFANGGNDLCLEVPIQRGLPTLPATDLFSVFPDSNRTEAELLHIARVLTASIQHSRAFGVGNSFSCSVVYANLYNQITPSASGVQPAVQIQSLIAGGIGNKQILYGATTTTEANGITYSGAPVPGWDPRMHAPWFGGNAYTGSHVHFNKSDGHYSDGLRNLTGRNFHWDNRGTLSHSFSGGGLRLVGWWKMNGPSIDPREPSINVISQTVATESMLEMPVHARFEPIHHQLESKILAGTNPDNAPNFTRFNYDGGEDTDFIRTNPALNIGGTWTSDHPTS